MKTKDWLILGLIGVIAYLWWRNKSQPAQTSAVFNPSPAPQGGSTTVFDPSGNIISTSGVGSGIDTSATGLPLGMQYPTTSGQTQTYGTPANAPSASDPGWVATIDPNYFGTDANGNYVQGITGWTLVDSSGVTWTMNNIGTETNPIPDPSSIMVA